MVFGGCKARLYMGMYDYAMLCDSKDERLRWLHEAASRGLADAQVALIRHYCDLDMRAKIIDVVEAYKWALLAAEQRHPCVFETNQFEWLGAKPEDAAIAGLLNL